MNCYDVCTPSSSNYNPRLCKICNTIKYLYYARWRWPWPPRFVIDPNPEPAKEYLGPTPEPSKETLGPNPEPFAELLGEVVLETIRKGDLHASSRILTTMRDSGLIKEVLESNKKELEEELEIVNQQIESLGKM